MILNKLFEISDTTCGELAITSKELNKIIDNLRSENVHINDHRIRYWEWPLHAFVANPSAGDRILDIGAGKSPLIHWFESKGCECWGCDIDESDPTFAKSCESKGIKLIKASIFDLPFEDGYFDFITSTCVLEHVANLKVENRRLLMNSVVKGLEEVLRVLKKGCLTSHSVDFSIQGFNEYSQFNKYDLELIARLLKDKAEQVGGVDYDVPDPFEYYLRDNPIFNPDIRIGRAIKECLRNKVVVRDGWLRTCASFVLRKNYE